LKLKKRTKWRQAKWQSMGFSLGRIRSAFGRIWKPKDQSKLYLFYIVFQLMLIIGILVFQRYNPTKIKYPYIVDALDLIGFSLLITQVIIFINYQNPNMDEEKKKKLGESITGLSAINVAVILGNLAIVLVS
jgi:hypothetical protein